MRLSYLQYLVSKTYRLGICNAYNKTPNGIHHPHTSLTSLLLSTTQFPIKFLKIYQVAIYSTVQQKVQDLLPLCIVMDKQVHF